MDDLTVKVAWETDGATLKSCGLKSRVTIPAKVLEGFFQDCWEAVSIDRAGLYLKGTLDREYVAEAITDWLSDEYGWLHNGWSVIER